MVWNDKKITEWAGSGGVTPFLPELVNPASLDLRIGNQIREPHPMWERFSHIDIWNHINKGTIDDLPKWGESQTFDVFWLFPHRFVLCHSLEFVQIPDNCISLLFSKSSTGRIGLEHLHAGLGDPGWGGDGSKTGGILGSQWTWELHNVAPWPVKLEAGKRVMQQIMVRMTDTPARTYKETGRYNNQSGATPAKV